MVKEIIYTKKAPLPIGPYSQATKAGDFIFSSGQIAINPETGKIEGENIEEQTYTILTNIKNILEASGFTLEDIVNVFVFLKDLKDYNNFNKIYEKFFEKNPPARTTVEVSNLPKGALLEISFIAYRGKK